MKETTTILKTSAHRRAGTAAIAVAMALGLSTASAPDALANQTDGANGVQGAKSGIIDYQAWTGTSQGGSWGDSGNESSAASDYHEDGEVHLFYDTAGGKWQESGPDKDVIGDNISHDNGTYIVTIPTVIAYDGMSAGAVATTDSYTVNVRGLIGGNQKVALSATQSSNVVNSDLGSAYESDIVETTSQGKTTWTAAEVFGSNGTAVNKDGSLMGTDCTDTIKMTGTARASGLYKGSVAYTAKLQ